MSFMQVATHATRNFATLGPSELQPPFTGIYINNIFNYLFFILQHRADIRPYTSFYNFAESCVFNKQSLPSIFLVLNNIYYLKHSLSRSYRVNLPSSLRRVLSRSLVFSTFPPVSVYGTGLKVLTYCRLFLEVWHQSAMIYNLVFTT